MIYESNDKIELTSNFISHTVVEVLPFLKGRKIDKVVMGYLHALRPSCIRVCRKSAHMTAMTWRVTIWLNKDEIIRKIEQEVDVGLYEDVENGHHLECIKEGVEDTYPREGVHILDSKAVIGVVV